MGMITFEHIPNISFDVAKAKAKMRPYLIAAMDKSADELIKNMKRLVHQPTAVGRTGKGAPGDPEWRNEIDRNIHRVFEHITDSMLEYGVGINPTEEWAKVRANIVDLGAGSAVGNPPIHAGPEGRIVWNDSLTGREPSRVKTERDQPKGFNQQGNNFVEEALDATYPFFEHEVAHALDSAPADLLADCLIIS